ITATLAGRRALAAIAMLFATLLHPLIASAGLALLTILLVGLPRPRLALTGCVLALVVSLGLALGGAAPFTRFGPADTQWFSIVKTTSPFLFLSQWSATDWARITVPLATLGIGALTAAAASLRRLCLSALITACAGLLLTALYCDGLKVIFITSSQPWRWLW